jgi:hypothetical protein
MLSIPICRRRALPHQTLKEAAKLQLRTPILSESTLAKVQENKDL